MVASGLVGVIVTVGIADLQARACRGLA